MPIPPKFVAELAARAGKAPMKNRDTVIAIDLNMVPKIYFEP
jgi:hypothetical protein